VTGSRALQLLSELVSESGASHVGVVLAATGGLHGRPVGRQRLEGCGASLAELALGSLAGGDRGPVGLLELLERGERGVFVG
jgi:hypothetical protein